MAGSRFAPVVLVGTAVLACATAEPDTTPPVLREAERIDAQTIRLTFSEAMVTGSADPAAFRLSFATQQDTYTAYYALAYDFGYDDGGSVPGDPSATGSDPGTDGGGYDDTYGTADGGDEGGYDEGDGYAAPPRPDALTLPIPTRFVEDVAITGVRSVDGAPEQVELTLGASLDDSPGCEAVRQRAASGEKVGIFVHHRQGGGSPTDAAGNAMADLAAHWVVAVDKPYAEIDGDFASMDPYLPITCP